MKPATLKRISDVRRIAVVRANGLGDFMFSLPAIEALRFTYPAAEIVLLAKEWHREFLANRPSPIDRVEVIPVCPGVGAEPGMPAEVAALDTFFAARQAEQFDLAIQLHGGGRYSNPFTRRLGARLTVGLKAPEAEPLDRWIPYVYYQPEVMRYLEVMTLVGAVPAGFEPRVEVTAADRAAAATALPDDGRPLAVLHAGATDGRRCWPAEKFAAVGDALAEAGAGVALIGTGHERTRVAAVIGNMQTAPVNLCDALTLSSLTGLLARATVVVSNDSGPLHLAAAVGAATVGVYWCGNLINGGPATRARHRPAISWRLQCPECGVNTLQYRCEHRASFVADVRVDEVLAAALDLVATPII